MPTTISRVKHVQKLTSNNLRVFHYETDSDSVLVGEQSLTDVLEAGVIGNQTFTLTGDVQGSATVTKGGNVTISTDVGDDSHNHSGSTIRMGTSGRALVTKTGTDSQSNEYVYIDVAAVTATELGYLSGVTANIQTQLNGKVAGPASSTDSGLAAFNGTTGKTIKKAGAIGSATQGFYLDSNGVPTVMSYTLSKSVPSNAVFTDTTYSNATTTTAGLMSATDKLKLDNVVRVYWGGTTAPSGQSTGDLWFMDLS